MKENMNRRTFVTQGCACGALLLAGTSHGISETTEAKPPKEDLTHPVNPPQVMAVLTDIDRSGDKNLIDAVFTRWGYQCFHTRGDLKAFAEKQRANFQGYVDYVNGNRSRYWEKLEYDKDSRNHQGDKPKVWQMRLRLRAVSATGEGAMHPLLQGPANRVVQGHDRPRRNGAD